MTFYLRVPSDGNGHPASSIAGSFLSDGYIDETHLHQPPREFEIYPTTGTLEPQSEVEIQVSFNSEAKNDLLVYVSSFKNGLLCLSHLISEYFCCMQMT